MINQALLNNIVARMRGRGDVDTAAQKIKSFRLSQVEQAQGVRPYWLVVKKDLDNVPNKVTTGYSTPVNFPLLLLGAITNFEGDVNLYDIVNQDRWTREVVNARAIAGIHPDGTGFNSPLPFQSPIELRPNNQIAVDFKNTAGVAQTAYFVIVCLRVFSSSSDEAQIDNAQRDAVSRFITDNSMPRNYLLKMDVPFDGITVGEQISDVETKSLSTPLLIMGVQTNLKNCTVTLKDSGGNAWSPIAAPIWSIAAYSENAARVLNFFPEPYFLPANSVLRGDFINTINGVTDDPGEVDFICLTP